MACGQFTLRELSAKLTEGLTEIDNPSEPPFGGPPPLTQGAVGNENSIGENSRTQPSSPSKRTDIQSVPILYCYYMIFTDKMKDKRELVLSSLFFAKTI